MRIIKDTWMVAKIKRKDTTPHSASELARLSDKSSAVKIKIILTKPNHCEKGHRIDFVPLHRARYSLGRENAVSNKFVFVKSNIENKYYSRYAPRCTTKTRKGHRESRD